MRVTLDHDTEFGAISTIPSARTGASPGSASVPLVGHPICWGGKVPAGSGLLRGQSAERAEQSAYRFFCVVLCRERP
jgi:hypothetical protein